MYSNFPVGHDDADYAERASIVAEVAAAEAAAAKAQAGLVRSLARAAAHAQRLTRTRAARDREMALRSVAAEIACAVRLSDRTVQRRIDEAGALATGFPETLAAWEQGRIGQGHVRAVTDAGRGLDLSDRALLDRAAVAVCEAEAPAGARRLLDMLAEELNPRSSAERQRDAHHTRSVRLSPLPDGMAELIVILPATLARAIHDRLTRQARTVRDARELAVRDARERARSGAAEGAAPSDGGNGGDGAGEPTRAGIVASDERTMDEIRADVLADTLLTAGPQNDLTTLSDAPGGLGAIRAHVQVTVPALTLAGVGDAPALIDGCSPIDADTARILAGTASGWDRVLTHPISGAVLAVDRYTPNAALHRFLRARDQHCRFPGCRIPALRCDVDHTNDHARGGPTDVGNLAHLCRRHHVLKHAEPWTVTQRPGGVLQWTSPLGHTYSTHPPVVGSLGPPRGIGGVGVAPVVGGVGALPVVGGVSALPVVRGAGTPPPPAQRGHRAGDRRVRFVPDGDPPPF
jgi:hypothetical protein